MDDERFIPLTGDEENLIREQLLHRLERCISVGEEIVIKDLIEKLENYR